MPFCYFKRVEGYATNDIFYCCKTTNVKIILMNDLVISFSLFAKRTGNQSCFYKSNRKRYCHDKCNGFTRDHTYRNKGQFCDNCNALLSEDSTIMNFNNGYNQKMFSQTKSVYMLNLLCFFDPNNLSWGHSSYQNTSILEEIDNIISELVTELIENQKKKHLISQGIFNPQIKL